MGTYAEMLREFSLREDPEPLLEPMTGSSVTGCSGSRYDAQGIMTHEAGHAFGLGHVAQPSLQVMKPASDVCETDQRLLGPGGLAGMKYLYP